MSAATTLPEAETYATHRRACPICRVFADECATGRELRAAADALLERARGRALRDAAIARGVRKVGPEPGYGLPVFTLRRTT